MTNSIPIAGPETLLGFASRYACYRGVRLPQLMRLTGIKIWHYASFETAVSRLGAMSGNDPSVLASHALRPQDAALHLLRGQMISRRDVFREAARFCPHCVCQDFAAGGRRPIANVYCRASWLNKLLTVCPDHEIELVSLSQKYLGYAREDFSSALTDNWAEVLAAADAATPASVSAYDRYFTSRINGDGAANELLDALPYNGAQRICEIVGAMETYGDRVAISKLPFEGLQKAAKLGFDILSSGYEGLRSILQKRDHRREESDDKGVGKQLYGSLYTYLHEHARKPEFAPVVEFVCDHAFSVHALGPENNFLGSGGVRKLHSIRSASVQYGIHPATLRKMLHASDLLAPDCDLRDLKVSIPAEQMDALAARWKDGVPMLYVRKRLDASPQVITQLTEAGHLTASDREIDHKLKKFYSSSQIEAFMARIEDLAVDQTSVWTDMVPLKHCAPFMVYAEIISLILEEKLAVRIVKSAGAQTTLSHLRVNEAEVRQAAGVGIPAGYYDTRTVAARLPLTVANLGKVVESGMIETTQYRGPNGVATTAYSKASVNAFTRTYICFRKLARQRSNWEKTEQRVAGVAPVFDFGGTERVYRKVDVGL
ncbi:TniQ family protein [Ensifer aridi]|uniref:TniQ family protein n=1 Tax=Ensifer aridi TaxID=1708715 RepID=UPI00358F509D